jgi:hypothetical protein
VLLALIAALAVAAVGAASASAWTLQPEFVLKPGSYFPASIEGSMHAGKVSFDWPTTNWGTCTENKTSGTITSAKAATLTLEWAGCSSGSTQWHSEGAPEGHIVLTGTGHLNYISSSPEKVGIVLAIKEVKLLLGTTSIMLKGSLVIPVSPTNTETSKLGLPVHETGPGEQEYNSYENEAHKVVEARPLIEFGTAVKKAGFEIEGSNERTVGKTLTVWTSPLGSPPPKPEFVLGEGESYPVATESAAPATKATLGSAAGTIACEGTNTKGSITGSTAGSQSLEFQHCKENESECRTAGAGAGVIDLGGTATLAYIAKSEHRVGIVFKPEAAEITCGSSKDKLQGALVIPASPLGIKTTTLSISLTRNGTAYENTYTSYENEKGEKIAAKLELNFGTGYKKGFLETGELNPALNKALTVTG